MSGSDSHPVAVISYQLWRNRFKGDPQIVGKMQRLNNVPHTIIGVAPAGILWNLRRLGDAVLGSGSMEETFENGGYKLEDRNARWIEAYVRIKPGVSRAQAQQEISAIAARLQNSYPATNRGRGIQLWALWQTPFNNAGTLLPTLEVMVAVVAFVLLIACANVGNLLLVRSFARRHEMTRSARHWSQPFPAAEATSHRRPAPLGAGNGWRTPGRVLVPARTRVAVPGALGNGNVPARGNRRARDGAELPGVCLMATLVVGFIPAFQTRKLDVAGPLKAESVGVVGAAEERWMRSGLVIFQVCLSFILLVGAALLVGEPAEDSHHRPRFFHDQRCSRPACPCLAAGYDLPHAKVFEDELIDSSQRAARCRVRSLRRHDSRWDMAHSLPRPSRWTAINLRLRNNLRSNTTRSVLAISPRWASRPLRA